MSLLNHQMVVEALEEAERDALGLSSLKMTVHQFNLQKMRLDYKHKMGSGLIHSRKFVDKDPDSYYDGGENPIDLSLL